MKRCQFLMALGCLVLAGGPALAQKGKGGGEQQAVRNGWLFSLAEGKARALQTNRPLMVVVRCVP
jgi:hypothetical protein